MLTIATVQSSFILDAVRTSDNSLVVPKEVSSWRNPGKVEISQYLSTVVGNTPFRSP